MSLLNIWQNVEPASEIIQCYWAHFHYCKLANIENIIKPYGHTERHHLNTQSSSKSPQGLILLKRKRFMYHKISRNKAAAIALWFSSAPINLQLRV